MFSSKDKTEEQKDYIQCNPFYGNTEIGKKKPCNAGPLNVYHSSNTDKSSCP